MIIKPKPRKLIVPALAAGVIAAPAIILAPRLVDALQVAGVAQPSRFTDIGALPAKQQMAVRRALNMMSKMSGLMGGGDGLTLAFVDSTSSNADTITGSTSIAAGDVLVLWDAAQNASGQPSTVVPSGFTFIHNLNGSLLRCIMSYKIADGSENGATITGMDATASDRKLLGVWRGNRPITSVTPHSVDGELTTGNPTSKSIPVSASPAPSLLLTGYRATSVVSPLTISPGPFDAELQAGSSSVAYLCYMIFNNSPVDQSVDMDDEGTNCIISCYLTFA